MEPMRNLKGNGISVEGKKKTAAARVVPGEKGGQKGLVGVPIRKFCVGTEKKKGF